MKKRLFSIVLSLCMVLALMPQMVFAEGNTSTAPSVSAYEIIAGTAASGQASLPDLRICRVSSAT